MKSMIGDNIQRVIKDKGLKQSYVAQKAGYDPKVFSSMLRGRQKIRDIDVIAIYQVLDTTPNELFGVRAPQAS